MKKLKPQEHEGRGAIRSTHGGEEEHKDGKEAVFAAQGECDLCCLYHIFVGPQNLARSRKNLTKISASTLT
jgi:hypothetical protein